MNNDFSPIEKVGLEHPDSKGLDGPCPIQLENDNLDQMYPTTVERMLLDMPTSVGPGSAALLKASPELLDLLLRTRDFRR